MTELVQLVVFNLDAQRYALPLASVERIVRAVEATQLPNAPAIVFGAINMAGRILPVLNLRRRFGLPEREIRPVDQFLIANTTRRTVALVVDEAQGIIEYPVTGITRPAQVIPGLDQLLGMVGLSDGLVLIQDLEKCLSLDESRALDEALNQEVAHGL